MEPHLDEERLLRQLAHLVSLFVLHRLYDGAIHRQSEVSLLAHDSFSRTQLLGIQDGQQCAHEPRQCLYRLLLLLSWKVVAMGDAEVFESASYGCFVADGGYFCGLGISGSRHLQYESEPLYRQCFDGSY